VKWKPVLGSAVALLVAVVFSWAAVATDAQMYFSSDKNGQNRVTNIQEGDEIWIVVIDNDENIDCDVRDKVWTDIKIMDPKTGAYIVWISYMDADGDAAGVDYNEYEYVPFKGHYPSTATAGSLNHDYLEETGADTGVFVSSRAFQVGTREDFDVRTHHAHMVSRIGSEFADVPQDFQWGNYTYLDQTGGDIHADNRVYGWSVCIRTVMTPLT